METENSEFLWREIAHFVAFFSHALITTETFTKMRRFSFMNFHLNIFT